MIQIGEVVKTYGVDENKLRRWEEKGFLGDVVQIDHARVYNEDQIERIQFIIERTKNKKRINYKELEEALVDKFGGVIEKREAVLPPEVIMQSFVQKMETRDQEIFKMIQKMSESLQERLENKTDTTIQEDRIGNLETNFARLVKVHEALVEDYKSVNAENKKLKEENRRLTDQLEEKPKKKGWFFGR